MPVSSPASYRRAVRALLVTFVIYGLLVASHLGEFWPFSIYPMFSRGGNPWSRAVVRTVPADADATWQTATAKDLPGKPYPLLDHGIDPIDLSNFVSKTTTWHANRVQGLRDMFQADELGARDLVVMRVNGRIDARDSVIVEFVPYARLGADTTRLHPDLPTRPDDALSAR
jgi:hypothetical protein